MANLVQRSLEGTFHFLYRSACTVYIPLRKWLGAAILAIFICMTTAVVYVFPDSNWDMLAYTATVLEPEFEDITELHRQTYDLVRQNVSEGEYVELTQNQPYRIRQANDPEAFGTMFGFYRLKILYLETARLLTGFMDPVQALRAISMVSAVAMGGILLLWLARARLLEYGPLVVAFLVLADFPYSAQLLSPDLFASVFVVLAGYLYLERLDTAAAASLLAAFLVRPDHLAFIGVFFVFAAIYGPGRWHFTACFAACFGIYVWLTRSTDHPGWWVHMWFTHVEYVGTIKDFDPPFSTFQYLQMLVRSTVRSLMGQTWLAILFLQVVFFASCIRPAKLLDRERVLLYAVFASVCAKYVVFPHFESRFHLPYLIIMAMILMIGWSRQSEDSRSQEEARTLS